MTQGDIDAGSVSNTASATATTADNGSPTPSPSTSTVFSSATPSLALTKSASTNGPGGTSYDATGQIIAWAFSVQNTGPVTLSTVSVSDTTYPSIAITCAGDLTPGDSESCPATDNTYTVTQGDIDAGSVSNTASATATTADNGSPTPSPSTSTVFSSATPSLALTKSAGANGPGGTYYDATGQIITWAFSVQNTGPVTLSTVSVSDTTYPSIAITCAGDLAPGDSESCPATDNTYTVTQGDIDAGSVSNTASATATTADNGSPTPSPSTSTVFSSATPSLALTKSASTNGPGGTSYDATGQIITWAFSVQNTGPVTLSTVSVSDTTYPSIAITCAGDLAPGDSESCPATDNTYTVTQGDIDAGSVSNTASATATTADNGSPTPSPSTSTVFSSATPSLALTKSASTNGPGGTSTTPPARSSPGPSRCRTPAR